MTATFHWVFSVGQTNKTDNSFRNSNQKKNICLRTKWFRFPYQKRYHRKISAKVNARLSNSLYNVLHSHYLSGSIWKESFVECNQLSLEHFDHLDIFFSEIRRKQKIIQVISILLKPANNWKTKINVVSHKNCFHPQGSSTLQKHEHKERHKHEQTSRNFDKC